MRSVVAALSTLAVAAGVVSAGAVSAAAPPNFGQQYYIQATMSLPYAGIVEPIESWFDTNKLRVDYYGGMDSYVYRGDINVSWQANPQNNVMTCTTADGAPSLNPYFPDLTGFQVQGDAVQINNVMCDDWQLVVTTLNKTSTYDLFLSRATGMPVRYQMMGYDSLIGSHFDLYVLDYQTFLTGVTWNSTVFDQPLSSCGTAQEGSMIVDAQAEIAAYFPGGAAAQADISDDYAAYLAKHNKAYETDAELRTRHMQFNKHSHFINAHQRRYRIGKESYSVGLNFLADHTADELAGRRGRKKTPKAYQNKAGSYHLRNYYDADLPDSIDWRTKGAVTRPQDQGICGSCWSFGSTGNIEGAYFLKYGQLKTFAEQELMDCSWSFGNNACDGGLDFQAYEWVMSNGGMSFKENYGPYLMQDGYCSAGQRTPDASIKSYVNTTEFSVPALQDALASVGPISVSIDASHPGLSFYTGGVYYDPNCGSGVESLDHSVLAVGYGTDPVGGPYWIVRNNWSEYWGVDGYILMSSTNNNCGVASTPTYVILN